MKSSRTDLKSGVPQRSVMGPLLYLLFVNDLPDIVTSGIKMFADDTKIWGPVKTAEDGRSLQNDLDGLSEWSQPDGHSGSQMELLKLAGGVIA